eukprot:6995167-Pyramimonas_sp.AAC.1
MASTVCKLYYRHVRALALQYLAQCLLAEQCGGVTRKGPDMALHGVFLASQASIMHKSAIKQCAMDLPGEEEKLRDALER